MLAHPSALIMPTAETRGFPDLPEAVSQTAQADRRRLHIALCKALHLANPAVPFRKMGRRCTAAILVYASNFCQFPAIGTLLETGAVEQTKTLRPTPC